MPSDNSSLVRRDRRHVWHPYAAPVSAGPLFPVVSARGVRLTLADGRELVDGMSSWWAAIHGYAHPVLDAALREQLERMPHVMFGGLTHEPAVALCETLADLAPGDLTRVFLSDSGSVSVEVAIKLALQYWQALGKPERKRMLTLRGGYHGDTFGAMSVCDPVTGMHALFRDVLSEQLFAERPACAYGAGFEERHIEDFSAKLRAHRAEIAAVILEPIVQGAGGMWFYAPEYLRRVHELCAQHDVLLIFDEIATGFGRTGELFGCDHAGVAPDIMCVGKALTGGTLSLAATLVNARVCSGVARGEPGALLHGPTFMGNPLACAAARASLGLLGSGAWRAQVKAIETQLRDELEVCRTLPQVADVRVLGAIGVVEVNESVDMSVVQPAFVDRGVWLRPFGRLVYTMPPFVTAADDISRITSAMRSVITEHCASTA